MGKNAPTPPDPKETASASTGTNIGTAIANATMGNVNQVTPDGTLTYNQTGSTQWTDPYTGQSYTIPTYTATQTLSAAQQAIKNEQNRAQQNLAGLAADQSIFLRDYLSKPFDLSNEATEARLMELGRTRLDPILAQRREAEEARLANQGVRLGSTGYDRAMTNVLQGENDAYNQLLLQGRAQAVQEALTERNQPLNEIAAIMSGSQVSLPNFVNTSMPSIPTTDVGGLINENYNQRLGIWEREQQQTQQILGGLFGLAGSFARLSDDDAKKDKTKVAPLGGGANLWAFRYKGAPKDSPKEVGLMASEVEKIAPQAVRRGHDGYRRVNYPVAMGAILRAA